MTASDNFKDFFVRFNLMDLYDVFLENDFRNIEGLLEVENSDLVEMGVTKLGLRKSFLGALKKVSEEREMEKTEQTPLHEVDGTQLEGNDPHDTPEQRSRSPVSRILVKPEETETKKFKQIRPADNDHKENTPEQCSRNPASKAVTKPGPLATPRRSAAPSKRKALFNTNHSPEQKGSQKLITTMFNGSPSTYAHARKKGIKIYNDTEIRRAKGFDKLRLPFLNEISERLAKDGLKKTEIIGAADFEWRLRKCELISSSTRNATSPSVLRNVERMETAYKKVKESALVVEKARRHQKHILADQVEKEDLCYHMVELRKSQDAITKAMKRMENKAQKEDSSSDSDLDIEVSEEDYEEAVREVKRKRDVYDFDD